VNLVADESVDGNIVMALRADGHEVMYIAECQPGISDDEVLAYSANLQACLLTADKDFGELVYRRQMVHHGVILLRLAGQQVGDKALLAVEFIKRHGEEIGLGFAVVTPEASRIRRPH
jgi:predicted nuclease of predicted toxin-antitoxin system